MNTQNAGRIEADGYDAQRMFEAWGQAWRESTQGMMVASVEQLELTKTLNSRAFNMIEEMAQPCSAQELAESWLRFVRPSFETAIEGYRRINDGLARSFFAVAEGFTHGIAAGATSPEAVVEKMKAPAAAENA